MISPKILKEIIKNTDLAGLFINILTFRIYNKFIIFEKSQISNDFASTKTSMLKCLNILIQFIMDSKKKLLEEQEKVKNLQTLIGMDLPDTPFVNVCSNVIQNIIETLLEISSEMVIPQILEDEGKLFIIESIELCVKCCGESRFFPVFAEVYKKLILEFVPNALNILKSERDNAEDDPSEFVNMGMDICERQESENIRSTVAKLLEAICDNIDGALTFFVGAVMQSVDLCLSSKIGNNETNQVSLFSYDEERILNNAVLMMCTVSYYISRRKDLIENLEHMLSKYFDVLTNVRSGVIHSRLCLMLYFYSEHLYQEDECWLMKWFWFLIWCMSPENTSKISMIQACETFSSLVQEEEIMLRIHAFIPEIFSKLILCVPGQNNKNFFEAISEYLNWHTELSKDQALELVNQLVHKIQFLVSNYPNSKENSILIAKCWNIIKGVSNSEILANSFDVKNIQVEFERILAPLISMLNQPQKQSFEEDIIIVMTNMMRKKKSISKIQWEMFGILPLLQQKQEDSLHGLLKMINNYILFGNEYIINTDNCLRCLVEIAVKALYSKNDHIIKESYNAEGAILLQYIITAFPGYLDNYLPSLLSSVISRYRDPIIKENFLKIRLLSVILSALAYNFSMTCSILASEFYSQNVTFLRYIFLEILAIHNCFDQAYDKKAAILGLCQMFLQPCPYQDLTELSGHIFETLILILTSKPITEDTKKSKMNKLLEKIIKNEIDDMSDSEIMVKGARLLYSDTNAGKDTEENSIIILATSVLTGLIEFDEIEFFKQVLNGLNTSNPGWIKSVISSLTEERQKQLVEIVMSKTLKLDFPGMPPVVRKIVKAKRK
ncbi:hypothetical protein SteCoe_25168 [Stentor coeruleus]|uniref:Uncharacterized protein n=1 Tax=Stentor coeruleus TaxID=5963 RepID=A0A1R2BG86_9CILI|nr:hypothetical protein SteCoe_25168 [Stentor coeruleus]